MVFQKVTFFGTPFAFATIVYPTLNTSKQILPVANELGSMQSHLSELLQRQHGLHKCPAANESASSPEWQFVALATPRRWKCR